MAPKLRTRPTDCVPYNSKEYYDMRDSEFKRRYAQAYYSLYDQKLTKKDFVIKMFVKFEKEELSAVFKKPPRAVQFANPRLTFTVGKYLHRLDHVYYDTANFLEPYLSPFAKGMNGNTRYEMFVEKCARFNDPVYIMTDISRFDSCQNEEWLTEQHKFEASHFGKTHSKFLRFLSNTRIKGKGWSTNGLKYQYSGGRMSGYFDTSQGNGFTHLAMWCLEFYDSPCPWDILLDGDDGVIIVERKHVKWFCDKVDTTVERSNFEIKSSWTDNVLEIVFCQSRFCAPLRTMIPDPNRYLARVPWTIKNFESKKSWLMYFSMVGSGMTHVFKYVPLLQKLGERMVEIGGVRRMKYDKDMLAKIHMSEDRKAPEGSMQDWFNEVTQMSSYTQDRILELIKGLRYVAPILCDSHTKCHNA